MKPSNVFKHCLKTFSISTQCTKSAKSVCPEDKVEEVEEVEMEVEEENSEEKVKTCIDSGKLLRCIRSVRIVCPKSTN